MSINRVNISGNLTRDPELRSLPSGTQVLSFGVAVNDRVRNQTTGNWEDRPNYVDCVVFGNRAEPLNRFLSKGSKVAIEGKLRWSQWQDKQTGSNRSKLEVVVDQVEFLSPRDQDHRRHRDRGISSQVTQPHRPSQPRRRSSRPRRHSPPHRSNKLLRLSPPHRCRQRPRSRAPLSRPHLRRTSTIQTSHSKVQEVAVCHQRKA